MNRRLLLASSAALAALTAALLAHAVGTRTFELDTIDDLSGGDLKGTSVDSLGRVRAGFTLGTLGLSEANAVWSALPLPDGSVLLGTGNQGKVIRITNGQASVYADTGTMVVTSMVTGFAGATFLGTMPKGRVLRLDGAGKVSTFADLTDVDEVWALAFDAKQNALFAATGPSGKLFRIDAAGHAQVYFDSDEPHLVALALASDGALYAGSSGKAILYRITQPGRATVVFDFPGDEVRAIVLGPRGVLYAISNEFTELPDVPKRSTGVGQSPALPVIAARPKPGKGTLTRIDAEGRPEKLLHRDDTHFVSLALGDDGNPYAGTGVEGRVYSVDDSHTSMLAADTDERQVGAMFLGGAKRFIATSDPPAYHEVRGIGGADAVWTSKVLDAGLRAHFGHATWRATGVVEISTRTGNTLVPDATWSEWSTALAAPGDVMSPVGRFFQVRARFSRDKNAVLSQLMFPFVTDNLRAVVTSVDAQPKNAPPPREAKDSLPPSGGETPAHVSVLKVTWKIDNPDSDTLRYRLAYRVEGQTAWRDITRPDEIVAKAEYEWDTASLPEGRYRIRVEASDENANPPELTARHALESALVTVDNTPPVFRTLEGRGRHIVGDVVDGVGPIARIDVAVDGRTEWRPYLPKDGIFDEPVEAFDLDVATLAGAGSHLVAIRVFDQAGNFVVRHVELK